MEIYSYVGPNGAGKTYQAKKTGIVRVEFARPLKNYLHSYILEKYGVCLHPIDDMDKKEVKDMVFDGKTIRDLLHERSAKVKEDNPNYLIDAWELAASKHLDSGADICVSDMRTLGEYDIAKKVADRYSADLHVIQVLPFDSSVEAKDAIDNGWKELPYRRKIIRNRDA